jgi:purine catabolism regulator
MEDPTPFLEGGELLMSLGIRFPRTARRQIDYIDRLAARELAGFALDVAECPRLTRAVLEHAERLPFPVFSVAPEVAFIDVVRTVADANAQTSQRRLMTHVRIFDSLQVRVTSGCTTAELLDRIATLTGYDLYADAVGGGRLLDGMPTVPAGAPRGHVLPIVVAGVTHGQLTAIERDGERPAGLVSVQHAAAIAALELERELCQARIADDYRELTLREMLAGQLPAAAVRHRLEREGFEPSEDLVLLALEAVDPSRSGQAVAGLRADLRRAAIPHLLTATDDLYALIATAALQEVPLHGGELRAGASRPFMAADGVELARREALLALHAAQRAGTALASFGGDAAHPSVLPVDRASLERLVDEVLGPLLRYDAEHNTTLVTSLRCYLEHDRGLQDAAARLFVHPNTLAYRLRRVEALTGRRLASVEFQTDLWLALRAQGMLFGVSPVTRPEFVATDN